MSVKSRLSDLEDAVGYPGTGEDVECAEATGLFLIVEELGSQVEQLNTALSAIKDYDHKIMGLPARVTNIEGEFVSRLQALEMKIAVLEKVKKFTPGDVYIVDVEGKLRKFTVSS